MKTDKNGGGVSKTEPVQDETPSGAAQDIRGRALFAVDTSAAGIVVHTGFLSEQGQLLQMPAVFPDLAYALSQIDHLRQIVIDRFAQAAQVGVQVIAAQTTSQPEPQAEAVADRGASDSAKEVRAGA